MLKGKVVLITGASRGIGKEIAIACGREGANVVVNYYGSKEKAEEVVSKIKEFGSMAIAVQADIRSEEEAKRLVDETLLQFQTIDILVNNAGITRDNLILRMSEQDYIDVVNTNLLGPFFMMKYVSKVMIRKRSGRIINLSSIVGVKGNAGQVNYAASKAGIIGMTKSLAKELAARQITVNAIAPGFIQTEMTEKMTDEAKHTVMEQIPLKRFGAVEDISNLVLFLASERSSYITGQTILVDGGLGM